MKRIIALFICILTVFACPMNAFAENSSDIETTTVVVRPTEPSRPQLKPDYQNINSIGLTFYVANGRAYASYSVSSQKNGISVSVKIEKKTLGILWVDIGDEKQEKTENKYISGSYSVPVSDSGTYCVTIEVTCNGEKVTNKASFEYDNKILTGDANSDGFIRANDARMILRYSAKLEKFTEKQKEICDINKDGSVNASDARIALRMAAKIV